MINDPKIASVVRQYPHACSPAAGHVESLGAAGGFSGARFWRWQAPRGMMCLRRWPTEHPTAERLQMIHAVLRHVEHAGFHLAAVPLLASSGQSYVRWAGHLWELSPWMPGRADYLAHPSHERLTAALKALASFHTAAATFRPMVSPGAPSPGLIARRKQLDELLQGGVQQLAAAVRPELWPEMARLASRWLAILPSEAVRVSRLLDEGTARPTPLQACLRDIWHDHLLFEGERVSGLVDFGAMRQETVACDLARLLGSLAGPDSTCWQTGLAAYESIRALSDTERQLIEAFDQSSVLLAPMNWFRWIFVEGRQFSAHEIILQRVAANLDRLTR